MRNFGVLIPVYWALFGGAIAVVAILDGPVTIVAIAGGVVGVALTMLLGAHDHDIEAELQRMAAGGDSQQQG